MNQRDRLRVIRAASYACQLRDPAGLRCMAPAAHAYDGEARCQVHRLTPRIPT